MAISKLTPYLIFNGDAKKAIALYERALGARTEIVTHFGDMGGTTIAPEHKDRVTHAMLHLGEGAIMMSDSRPEDPPVKEGNVQVCLELTTEEDQTAKFNALAEGGRVTMPLQDTFWGARFGMLVDAVGVQWMFNYTKPKA